MSFIATSFSGVLLSSLTLSITSLSTFVVGLFTSSGNLSFWLITFCSFTSFSSISLLSLLIRFEFCFLLCSLVNFDFVLFDMLLISWVVFKSKSVLSSCVLISVGCSWISKIASFSACWIIVGSSFVYSSLINSTNGIAICLLIFSFVFCAVCSSTSKIISFSPCWTIGCSNFSSFIFCFWAISFSLCLTISSFNSRSFSFSLFGAIDFILLCTTALFNMPSVLLLSSLHGVCTIYSLRDLIKFWYINLILFIKHCFFVLHFFLVCLYLLSMSFLIWVFLLSLILIVLSKKILVPPTLTTLASKNSPSLYKLNKSMSSTYKSSFNRISLSNTLLISFSLTWYTLMYEFNVFSIISSSVLLIFALFLLR